MNMAVVCSSDEPAGIVLYDRRNGSSRKIPFGTADKVGNINCMLLSGIDIDRYDYSFYEGDREYPDPHGKLVVGNNKWGKVPSNLRSGFVREKGNSYRLDYKPILRSYRVIPILWGRTAPGTMK